VTASTSLDATTDVATRALLAPFIRAGLVVEVDGRLVVVDPLVALAFCGELEGDA